MSIPISIPGSPGSPKKDNNGAKSIDGSSWKSNSSSAPMEIASQSPARNTPTKSSQLSRESTLEHSASQGGIGKSIVDFVSSFSPLTVLAQSSPLLSPTLNSDPQATNPSKPHQIKVVDFRGLPEGNPQVVNLLSEDALPSHQLSSSPSSSSLSRSDSLEDAHPKHSKSSRSGSLETGFVLLSSSPSKNTSTPPSQHGLLLHHPKASNSVKTNLLERSASVPPDSIIGTKSEILSQSVPGSPLPNSGLVPSASSSSIETSGGVATKLFSSLAYVFSKKEITGSIEIELITSIKKRNQASTAVAESNFDYLSALFEIKKDDLSNLDQLIVKELVTLFNQTQKEISESKMNDFASNRGQSPPPSSESAQNSHFDASEFAQNIQKSNADSVKSLNSNMETAVEWMLQARPRGYNYKGIGKLIKALIIHAKEPFDLHLTHIPLFLHTLPNLEELSFQNNSIATIPASTFFLSTKLEKVCLKDNKIKSIFTETNASTYAALRPTKSDSSTKASSTTNGTQTTADSSTSAASSTDLEDSSSDASSSTSDSQSPESTFLNRKEDIFDHLSSPLAYFAALEPPPAVKYLDLSINQISSIPPFISAFKNLIHLDLSRNLLYGLPPEIKSISTLEELNINNNYIFDLPSIPSLTKLSWRSNGIKPALLTLNQRGLLSSLSGFPNLTHLDLSGNYMDQLPLALVSLKDNLRYLDLSSNLLYTLVGDEISQFTCLEHLNLSNNKFKTIPAELLQLPAIKFLNLSENSITTLPAPITIQGIGKTIEHLDLSKNGLKQILTVSLEQTGQNAQKQDVEPANQPPQPVFACLSYLNLSSNKLTELPELFMGLSKSMLHLDLSSNILSKLPSSIAGLTSLKSLNISNNKIEAFEDVGALKQLEFLDLSANDLLTSLPRTFEDLVLLNQLLIPSIKVTRAKNPSQTEETRDHSLSFTSFTYHYSIVPLNPATSKAFLDKVPQILAIIRSAATHPLLLRCLFYLCKLPSLHQLILSNSLLYPLLSSARYSPENFLAASNESLGRSTNNTALIDFGQEQIGSLISIRNIAKNPLSYELLALEKPLIAVLGEHVIAHSRNEEAMKDEGDAKVFELDDYLPSKSVHHAQKINIQTKIRTSLTCLCLDSLCYLSFSQSLRNLINDTPDLVESIKALSTSSDHNIAERCKRTLAGVGVAPELTPAGRGVRILTLDGGGTRGITAAVMLRHIEKLSGKKIHEMFDLIVGTSTGALIATLAGWTRLTMAETVVYYREACGIIFAPRGTSIVESKYTLPVTNEARPNSHSQNAAKIFSLHHEVEEDSLLRMSTGVTASNSSASLASVPITSPQSRMSYMEQYPNLKSLQSSSVSIGSSAPSDQQVTTSTSEHTRQNSDGSSTSTVSTTTTTTITVQSNSASALAAPNPWQKLVGIFSALQAGAFYDATALESVLKNLGDPHATMLDTAANGDLRLVFTSTDIGVFPPQTFLLRNWSYAKDEQSRFAGTSALKMWESMRCTTAAPGYFDNVTYAGRRLADGGISTNNPAGIALAEARALWPDKKVDCLLSVGVGLKTTKPVQHSMSQLFSAMIEACTETEKTHFTLQDSMQPGTYFRLQPVDDVFDFPLDETKIEKLDAVEKYLANWMEQNDHLFKAIVEALLSNRKFESDNFEEASVDGSVDEQANNLDSSYSDDEEGPSPLRPIPSKTSILGTYAPLDELEQWDEDMW